MKTIRADYKNNMITETLNFCKEFGYNKLRTDTVYNNSAIGIFRKSQRYFFNQLTNEKDKEDMIKEFNCISPNYLLKTINNTEQNIINATIEYSNKYGFNSLKADTVYKNLKLGDFRDRQKQKFKSLEKEKEKEAMIKKFSVISPHYLEVREKFNDDDKIEATLEFCKQYGYKKLRYLTVYKNIHIGLFRDYQRTIYKTLKSKEEKEAMLKKFSVISPDYLIKRSEVKLKSFEATLEFCNKFGYEKLNHYTVYNGFNLGVLRQNLRVQFKSLKTEKEKEAMLKKFSVISPNYLIQKYTINKTSEYIKATLEFCNKFGYENLKTITTYNGIRIGAFRYRQRKKFKHLKTEKEKEAMIKEFLDISPDYLMSKPTISTVKSSNFNKYIKATLEFCNKFGYENLKCSTIYNGIRIGAFRNKQREEFKSLTTEEKKEAMIKEFLDISPNFLIPKFTVSTAIEYIKATLEFCNKFGYENLKTTTNYNGFNIGAFKSRQREKFKSLAIEEEKEDMIKMFSVISPNYLLKETK